MNPRRTTVMAWVCMGVLLAALPFLAGTLLGPSWVRVINFALLYVMLALGLNIVVGMAGLLDLGYIAFYAVGAYTYAWLASTHFGLHTPWWLILPLGAGLAALLGLVLGAPTLRLRGDYLAMVTLGLGEIVRIFLNNLNAPYNLTNGPQGISGIDPLRLAGVSLGQPLTLAGVTLPAAYGIYYVFLTLCLAVIVLSQRLLDSRIGRAWRAIRADEVAARACGIDTRALKLLAFAMGASLGGMAGGLFAGLQQFVSPESFGLLESVMVLCMVVLGGMGHLPGVVLGAILLALLPEVLRHLANPLQHALLGQVLIDPESLRLLVFGLALIGVMRWRPAGLWPAPSGRRSPPQARS